MLTLTNIICLLFIAALCKVADIEEAQEFKKAHGFTRRQFKKIVKMMQDSSYPNNNAWVDPKAKKHLHTFNYN